MAGDADGLVLNYARGFADQTLEMLSPDWGLKRLDVLDRSITDLQPLERLGLTLEVLSVQAAAAAELDLAGLPELRSLAGEWSLLRPSIGAAHRLQRLSTWAFDEPDLRSVRDHVELEHLTIKDARHLQSLSGIDCLHDLTVFTLRGAPRLADIADLAQLAPSLREVTVEAAPLIGGLDAFEGLASLTFLSVGDCGNIDSLRPIAGLSVLETLYAWGSTRIVDGDLSALQRLPALKELRMRPRREYRPSVRDIPAAVF